MSEPIFALVPEALYPLLGRYFFAHRQRFQAAHLLPESAKKSKAKKQPRRRVLFEVSPPVPRYVAEYLTSFPRVTIQEGAYDKLDVEGEPHFIAGDELTDWRVELPPLRLGFQSLETSFEKIEAPLVLRPDPRPAAGFAALVLKGREVSWLRRMLHLLPGNAFATYSFFPGDKRSLLVAGDGCVEGIPFGLPLRRCGPGDLFVPLRSRFAPDLPWELLYEALAVEDGILTFLTETERLDVGADDFAPLSRRLVADPSRRRLRLELCPSPLPELRWTVPPAPPVRKRRARKVIQSRAGKTAADEPRDADADPQAIETHLRKEARTREKEGDFLTAAVCYQMLDDSVNSARCYRQAARGPDPRN